YQYLTGKILGSIFVTIVQGFIVLMFSKLVLKAYWGEDLLTVAVLVITYSVMAVSLGAALAFVLRSGEAANGLLNTIIPILVFLGGGYVPVYVMGDSFSKLSVISPVRWINSALLNLIYDGNYSDVPISIAINLGLSVLFISVAVLLSGKGRKAYA
ncbi:MAG: ABC transporter permease, partial [Acetivibrionales bacterium]